jgi:hypothetical protein
MGIFPYCVSILIMKFWLLLTPPFLSISLVTTSLAKEAPNSVDHAGILQSLDNEDLAAGEVIYKNLCTNCHGDDGLTPPLPTARAFGSGDLKFGLDPYSMFLTLTNGNGLMGPQTWMTNRERYQVIHYIRESFMRPMRDDFEEINDGYLESLPTVNVVVGEKDLIQRNFGPALASQLGRDISSVLTIKLNPQISIAYDLHSMDQAGVWSGGFLDLLGTQHYRERGGGVANIEGSAIAELKGWAWGHGGTLDYPTDDLLPRGPMPETWMSYYGHYLHNDHTILSYAINGRNILETPTAPEEFAAIQHTFEIESGEELLLSLGQVEGASANTTGRLAANAKELTLGDSGEVHVLGTAGDHPNSIGRFLAAAAQGDVEGFQWDTDGKNRLTVKIPADDEKRVFQIVRYAGEGEGELLSFTNFLRSEKSGHMAPFNPSNYTSGGERRWPEVLHTMGLLGSESEAYTIDKIGIPENDEGNPYNAWFRTSALAFFPDGRMVVSTHGGDIWIVSGVDRELEGLQWTRFAAGLYEPFGLQVVDDKIYVTCKDRLTRLHDLNDDGEADFYESFSADDDVSTFFHAFNFDLQRDSEGNFYYAKSGQYTSYKEPGSVIKVSPDGKTREVYCRGFRTPNGMGMMPDGRPTVSDNQGSWMPASKISLCDPGGFYGYAQTFRTEHWAPNGGAIDHTKVIAPDTFDQPIIWMPQNFDNSSGGQLWIDDKRWGPLSGKLLHTSFGKGWLYYLMLQEVDGIEQAAIVKIDLDAETGIHRAAVNPVDGQVYTTGLNGWNGGGRKGLAQGGISRYRFTGTHSPLLTNVTVKENGITLDFNFALDQNSATNPETYELYQWNYAWTRNYGSAYYSVKNPLEEGEDEIRIKKAVLSEDGMSVHLVIPNIQPVNQVEINFEVEGINGLIFKEQAYLTINAVPGGKQPDMKELTRQRIGQRQKLLEIANAKREAQRAKKEKAKNEQQKKES